MNDYKHYTGFRIVEDTNLPPLTACFCIGPQNGKPLCPCAMKSVKVENGRYIQRIDLGPAAEKENG